MALTSPHTPTVIYARPEALLTFRQMGYLLECRLIRQFSASTSGNSSHIYTAHAQNNVRTGLFNAVVCDTQRLGTSQV